jgi:hypothetical protein
MYFCRLKTLFLILNGNGKHIFGFFLPRFEPVLGDIWFIYEEPLVI